MLELFLLIALHQPPEDYNLDNTDRAMIRLYKALPNVDFKYGLLITADKRKVKL